MLARYNQDHHRLLPPSALPHALLVRRYWCKSSVFNRCLGAEAIKAARWPLAHRSAWPTAQQRRSYNRPVVITHAGMNQQQYWQAFEDYSAQGHTYWEQRLSQSGIELFNDRQQGSRCVRGHCAVLVGWLPCFKRNQRQLLLPICVLKPMCMNVHVRSLAMLHSSTTAHVPAWAQHARPSS
jgi:hypothetical protein